MQKVWRKNPLDECSDKIELITTNDDCLLLKQIESPKTGIKSFPIRLDISMINELDTLACKTGKSRTEIIKILLDYALKRIKLV